MALKRKLTADEYESLSDALKPEYRKDGDLYVLEIAADDTTQKLKEMRDSSLKAQQEAARAKAELERFKDVDLDQYALGLEAKKKLDALTDKSLLEEGKLDEIVRSRVAPALAEKDKAILTERKAREDIEKKYAKQRAINQTSTLEKATLDAVSKYGQPRAGAREDILNRAKATFQFDEEDQIVAPERYDSASNPLTPETWAKELVVNSPHLFEAATGASAPGGKKGASEVKGKILRNPSNNAFAANAEAIAAGRMDVVRDQD